MLLYGAAGLLIFGYKNTMENLNPTFKPYATFRVVMYDVSDLPEGSYDALNPPKKAPIYDHTEHNQVAQVALNGFAGIINGESGFTGEINYLAVGTGANTPSISDTQLQAEIGRSTIVPSSNVRTNNSVIAQFYFGPTDANGNIKEVGAFIDATATANSGVLFDRALFDIVKTSLNSIYIYMTTTVSA